MMMMMMSKDGSVKIVVGSVTTNSKFQYIELNLYQV